MLCYETRLSADHTISCNICHQLDKCGVDGEPTSDGHKGQKGTRNSPTVCNAAGHVAQFWDGRAATVEEQAKGPVTNPVEMAMPNEKVLVAVLKSMTEADSFEVVASPPLQARAVIERACQDCHSNRTVWPWYSYVAPASWLVADDVSEANSGDMPLWQYRLMHPGERWHGDQRTGYRNAF
ncbi:MAG TPA: cytochrome c peroxidase [Bryobacteraceae bacterium]|nr:cytochrome c peroxidase [Bryobacteraceae bacterium]